MRKKHFMLLVICALLCFPNLGLANASFYLPDSSSIELQWEYTETPPKRPYPRLLNSARYAVKWKLDNPLMFEIAEARNGILYISDSDNRIQAIYPNGQEKWSTQLASDQDLSVFNLHLGNDGTLYAYSSDILYQGSGTTVFALSEEGAIKWKLESDNIISRFEGQFSGDVSGNLIYFTNEGLVSRNAQGDINWINGDITTSPPVEYNGHQAQVFTDLQGNIYVDNNKQQIISLDPGGNERWTSQPQKHLDSFNTFHPFFSNTGSIYMLTEKGLHGLDSRNGQNRKAASLFDYDDIRSSGIPTDGQGGYYISIRGSIQKIDANGNSKWMYIPRESEKYGVGSLKPLATDSKGNVYFPTGVGNIIGLDSKGHEIFAFLRNGFWHRITEIVIGANDNIYSINHDIGIVAFGLKGVQVYSDNLPLPLSVKPINEKGTVLVPFRSLFEAYGMKVAWDSSSKKITGSKEGLHLELSIGSRTAYVNGNAMELTEAPRIANGSTYVPLRFIGESLKKKVSWDGKSQFVNIDSD
jgi:hypothetical protein